MSGNPDEFPGTPTNYGEKFSAKIMTKFSDDVTLTLCNVKFLEKTPDDFNGVNVMVEFPSG